MPYRKSITLRALGGTTKYFLGASKIAVRAFHLGFLDLDGVPTFNAKRASKSTLARPSGLLYVFNCHVLRQTCADFGWVFFDFAVNAMPWKSSPIKLNDAGEWFTRNTSITTGLPLRASFKPRNTLAITFTRCHQCLNTCVFCVLICNGNRCGFGNEQAGF